MGRCREFHLRMRPSSLSTTVTLMLGFLKAMMAAVGPPASMSTRHSIADLYDSARAGEARGGR
jgi:hypothetical protein